MNAHILSQHAGNGKPQTGPVYRCPICGAPAHRLIPYSQYALPGGHLDDWGDHIAYLDLPTSCRQAGHPARVAVLGHAVASLVFPYDSHGGHATTEECITLIRQALDTLAQIGQPSPHDPAASIVYRLLAGLLSPQAAIEHIHALMMEVTQ